MIKQGKTYVVFQFSNVLLMVVICVLILYPIYYMIITSISGGVAVLTGRVTLLPGAVTLRAYGVAFADQLFVRSYWNTIVITVAGTAVNLVMTTACAYALSRHDLVGRKLITALITFTMFFSGGMIPSYLLVTSLKLANTYWAIILPGAINVYNMIVMRTFFQGIPYEITESAYMDGANDLIVLVRLILPLSVPILGTMLLFYAVGHWNGFYSALLYLTSKEMYPLQLFVRSIVFGGETLGLELALNSQSAQIEQYGGMMAEQSLKYAIIIASMLPILVLFPIISRHFKSGVMIGGLKG